MWNIHPKLILTHWGWVTHICVSKLIIIGSDNGLSPGRRQAITWTNVGILLIGPLGTKVREILSGIISFSFVCETAAIMSRPQCVDSFSPGQNGRHLPEDIIKCVYMNEKLYISIHISLKFVHKGPIDNIPALVQIMAWRRPGDKPLSEPMLTQITYAYMWHLGRWVKLRSHEISFVHNICFSCSIVLKFWINDQ